MCATHYKNKKSPTVEKIQTSVTLQINSKEEYKIVTLSDMNKDRLS